MNSLKDNTQRASQLKISLYVFLGLSGLLFTVLVKEYLETDFYALESNGIFSILDNYTYRFSSIPKLAAYVLSIAIGVLFILWFRRGYYNIGQLGYKTEYQDEGAASAWFIPIIWWIKPYKIMAEMHRSSVEFMDHKKMLDDQQRDHYKSLAYINGWWFFYIAYSVVSNISNRLTLQDIDPESCMLLEIFTQIMALIATWQAIKLIKTYHNIETQVFKANNLDAFGIKTEESGFETEEEEHI